MRITFDEVSIRGEKKARCPKCGKLVTRAKTFSQTLNPFNKLPNGMVKTRDGIIHELQAERSAWWKTPELCAKCRRDEEEK